LRLDYQSFSAKQPMKIMNNKWKQLAINKYQQIPRLSPEGGYHLTITV
jgi:hypothetical protein